MPPPFVTIFLEHPTIGCVTGRVTLDDTRTLSFESRDGISTIQSYADAIRAKVETYMAGTPHAPDELRGAANSGWLFLDSLFANVWETDTGKRDPALKAEILGWLGVKGGIVIIDSDYVHAPWNFLCLAKPGVSADVSDFLGTRQLVLQRVNLSGGYPPVWPARKVFAIHGAEKAMIAETDLIEGHANNNAVPIQRFPKDMTTAVVHCLNEFEALWLAADPSALHVASHLSPPPRVGGHPGPELSATIEVANDACCLDLEVGDVLSNVTTRRPSMELGFFNLCSLGKSQLLLHGGTASAFARLLGCSIFVDMKLHNDLAERFAAAFYDEYLAGKDPVEAYGLAKRTVSVSDETTVRALCYRFTFGDYVWDAAA